MSDQPKNEGSGDGGVSTGSTGYEEVEYIEEVVYEEVEEEVEEKENRDVGLSECTPGSDAPADQTAPGTAQGGSSRGASRPSEGALPVSSVPTSSPEPASTASGPETAAGAAADEKNATDTSDFRKIEEQATKVAGEVQHVAAEVSKKLQSTFLSAFGTSSTPAAGAAGAAGAAAGGATGADPAAGITAITGRLSQWWSTLDQQMASNNAPEDDKIAQHLARSGAADRELVAFFGLRPEEPLIEQFSCQMLQTYGCSHNQLTPSMQITFPGVLYITDRHSCFKGQDSSGPAASPSQGAGSSGSSSSGGSTGESSGSGSSTSRGSSTGGAGGSHAGRKLWFRIPHKAVLSARHEPGVRRRMGGDVLRVVVAEGLAKANGFASSSSAANSSGKGSGQPGPGEEEQWAVVFTDFASPSGLDGALALIEHLTESVLEGEKGPVL